MPLPKQARFRLRLKMLQRNLTFTDLARQIGRPRQTVSKAVNHGQYPRVLAKIQEVLQ